VSASASCLLYCCVSMAVAAAKAAFPWRVHTAFNQQVRVPTVSPSLTAAGSAEFCLSNSAAFASKTMRKPRT